MHRNKRRARVCDDLLDHLVGAQQGGYSSIPPLAVVFNLCDRRFDTRSGRMTWHLMKK